MFRSERGELSPKVMLALVLMVLIGSLSAMMYGFRAGTPCTETQVITEVGACNRDGRCSVRLESGVVTQADLPIVGGEVCVHSSWQRPKPSPKPSPVVSASPSPSPPPSPRPSPSPVPARPEAIQKKPQDHSPEKPRRKKVRRHYHVPSILLPNGQWTAY